MIDIVFCGQRRSAFGSGWKAGRTRHFTALLLRVVPQASPQQPSGIFLGGRY